MLYFFTLLCTTLNTAITSLFCCLILKGKHKVLFAVLASLFIPVLLVSLDYMGIAEITQGHPMRTILSLAEIISLLHICFEDHIAKKLLIFTTGAALQSLCIMIIILPLAGIGFFKPEVSQVSLTPQFVIAQYFGSFFYFICVLLIAKFIRKRSLSNQQGWPLLLLFITVQLFLLITSFVGLDSIVPIDLLLFLVIISLLCIGADLALFYVLEHITQKIHLEESANFYKTQLSMQLELYKNFSAYGETLLQTKAQITESLSHAQHSLRSQDYRAAESMLASLPDQLSRLRTVSYCENNIINALLFIKHRQMKQLGISFEYQVRLENDCFANQSDLCRILGNLLDNAIEACQKLPSAQTSHPKINLSCMPVKNTLLIQVENPFSGTLRFGKNGLPVSSKKATGHGRGLSGVRDITSKYGGTLQIRQNIESVVVSILIFCS